MAQKVGITMGFLQPGPAIFALEIDANMKWAFTLMIFLSQQLFALETGTYHGIIKGHKIVAVVKNQIDSNGDLDVRVSFLNTCFPKNCSESYSAQNVISGEYGELLYLSGNVGNRLGFTTYKELPSKLPSFIVINYQNEKFTFSQTE